MGIRFAHQWPADCADSADGADCDDGKKNGIRSLRLAYASLSYLISATTAQRLWVILPELSAPTHIMCLQTDKVIYRL